MLKKSPFPPARPRRAKTRLSPRFVLASLRSSTGTRPPHRLGGAHRRGAPYSSHRAPQRLRLRPSLAATLLNGLFEHPVRTFSRCASHAEHSSSNVSNSFPTICKQKTQYPATARLLAMLRCQSPTSIPSAAVNQFGFILNQNRFTLEWNLVIYGSEIPHSAP